MKACRICRGGAALAIVLGNVFVAGCKTAVNPTANTTESASARSQHAAPTTSPSSEPAVVDATTAMPDLLSKKTAAYAQSLDTGGAHPESKAPPSAVKWDDPKPQHPTERPPFAAAPAAGANTAAAVTTSSTKGNNAASPQVLALARSAKNNALSDVPAIVPEGADFAQPAPPGSQSSLEQRLNQRVKDNPRDVGAQLDNQLYAMINDQSAPQLAVISALPSEDRELVATLIDGLSNFRGVVRQDNNMLLAGKIRPLLEMADRLRSQAELSVPTLALCKRVDGFGKYETIEPHFRAGQENPVIVYCEIENFNSRLNDQHLWESKLTQEVTLFTDVGMLVWKDKSRDISDTCRNHRHDFFMYDLIHLPANLTIGRYIVKVSVIDRNANRVAEKTVPVEIMAQ